MKLPFSMNKTAPGLPSRLIKDGFQEFLREELDYEVCETDNLCISASHPQPRPGTVQNWPNTTSSYCHAQPDATSFKTAEVSIIQSSGTYLCYIGFAIVWASLIHRHCYTST